LTKNIKTILAIETSCDETASAVLRVNFNGKIPEIQTLSSVIKSQIKLHSKMGGVVPEVAARAHIKNILPVTQKALDQARVHLNNSSLFDDRQKVMNKKIDYIAVTQGPGLISSLIVGIEFAKALSFATDKPLIPVNHMAGHLYSALPEIKDNGLRIKDTFPMISLIVSGGHTMLVLMKNEKDYKVIGQTVDDAAGEAFDKVAKLLKLPYPGGPEVSKLAEKGKPTINFPRPMLNSKDYNFSFSGLKTAVLYYVQGHLSSEALAKVEGLRIKDKGLAANICASFQEAVVDVLVTKTLRAAKEYKAKSVSLSGGVAANTSLREKLKVESKKLKVKFFVPPKNLTTDNAEMIGIAAAFKLNQGYKPKTYKTVKADSNLEL
jgi:N6-L-threonylcarbamoyladenine synthase